jgi:hypothetical protein
MGNYLESPITVISLKLKLALRTSFTCGAYVALLPNPMVELGATEDVGRRMGMFMTIFALGALAGPPISGVIYSSTGGYKAVGYFAGMKASRPIVFPH